MINQPVSLANLHAQINHHLTHGIITFWIERAADHEYGGYYTNFNEQGQRLPMPEKYLNTQMRMVWWFSRLAHEYPTQAVYSQMARGGVDFMLQHFWDTTCGGWYWKTRRDGSDPDQGKVVYGQSFAIYSLSEYTLGTGDPRGVEYACKTFDLLQKFCADTRWGGYYENLERDWQISASGFNAGDRKSLDTHMHLMEAFTSLYAASQEEIHRRKLLEIVDLIANRMVDAENRCGLNQFDTSFKPIPAIAIRRTFNAERTGESPEKPTETTSFGHNVELVWLMRLALDTAGSNRDPYQAAMRALLDNAVQEGVDWELGGVYRDGVRGGQAIVLEKEFWQNAESLVGFLDGYEQFSDPQYLHAFVKIWQFAKDFMIVDGVGEWRMLVDKLGKPIVTDLANEWKVAYHTGRAMLECNKRLSQLITSAEKTG
jgi:mannobiose 2-epimerase